MQRWQRYRNPFPVLLPGIDHFKAVNDQHGHLVGDRVLEEFARIATERLHSTDRIGRYGGEEFVVLLTETEAPAASRGRPASTSCWHARMPPSTRPRTRAATPPSRPEAGARAGRRALRAAACLPHLRSSTTLNSKRNCTATFSGNVTTTRVSCG